MASKHVLVTGASGFVGRHLVPALLGRGYAVTGLGREPSRPSWMPMRALAERGSAPARGPAGRRRQRLGRRASRWRHHPQPVLLPLAQLDNVAMAMQLIEDLRFERLLFVSSCHVYAPSPTLLDEASPTRPSGRYGLSKHLAEQVMLVHADRCDIRVARPFNHLGAHMRPELMAPSLIERIRREQGSRQPLRMQGRDSTRDFLDVRDICEAYVRILELERQPDARIFNVASGVARKVSELARAALALVGDGGREIVFEGRRTSSDDSDCLVGDASRLRAVTGWAPRYALDETLRPLLLERPA